jgi:hypothetical protein
MTVEPETVHTVGESERNDTGGDPSASVEADRVIGWPSVAVDGGVKEIRC